MFTKLRLLALSITFFFSIRAFPQDIKDIAEKMQFPTNLPSPRLITNVPDSVNGISLVYEDLKSSSPAKLDRFRNIEVVELQFRNQMELEKELEMLPEFPKMKYLILRDWPYGSKKRDETIKLPRTLGLFTNIVAIQFSENLRIDYQEGLAIINKLPNLQYLFLQDYQQPIPEIKNGFKRLKGIAIYSRESVNFPEWITRLPNLESISLDMFNYSKGPIAYLNYFDVLSKLQKVPKLKGLYLHNIARNAGDFATLKFNKLKNIELENADFTGNEALFKFLTNHDQLSSISISGFYLRSLGPEFSKLQNLSSLSVRGSNDSLYVNFNLKDLRSLKSLQVTNCRLFLNQPEFPSNLVHLDLTSTRMPMLPNSIFELKKLESLSVGYNPSMVLPPTFRLLRRLEHLNMTSNRLNALPRDLGSLKSLKTLHLSANPITELPESIGKLKNLTVVDISHGNLKKLPRSIGELERLQVLNLEDNFITEIPESIIHIKPLRTLDLTNNLLVRLPKEIGKMSGLEVLNASFNNITGIPSSIGQLEAVKRLDLSYNDLDSLPEEISNLNSLQELYLSAENQSAREVANSQRGIYREDDPIPTRKVTKNNIKNFPKDLRKWTSIRRIDLTNNNEVNGSTLFSGLMTIPAKGYSLVLENCGLKVLPEDGWAQFYVGSLYLSGNQIQAIPAGIRSAPYLSEINLSKNQLKKRMGLDLNQYVNNRSTKSIWFVDLGLIAESDLPKTDSMAIALAEKSNGHYYRNEFSQAVNRANAALAINADLAMSQLDLTSLGEANYRVGNYQAATEFLSKAIKKDTASLVRVLNYVIPDFEYRAKSYLKLGDTLRALRDYETLGQNYSDSWGEVGLLYSAIHRSKEANLAFEKGIKRFEQQIAYAKKEKAPAEMTQLSLLELMIISEDFPGALKYAAELEKEFKLTQHLTLLRYLKASAQIASERFDKKSKPELLKLLSLHKKSIQNWSYDLFRSWLRSSKLAREKIELIRNITDVIQS